MSVIGYYGFDVSRDKNDLSFSFNYDYYSSLDPFDLYVDDTPLPVVKKRVYANTVTVVEIVEHCYDPSTFFILCVEAVIEVACVACSFLLVTGADRMFSHLIFCLARLSFSLIVVTNYCFPPFTMVWFRCGFLLCVLRVLLVIGGIEINPGMEEETPDFPHCLGLNPNEIAPDSTQYVGAVLSKNQLDPVAVNGFMASDVDSFGDQFSDDVYRDGGSSVNGVPTEYWRFRKKFDLPFDRGFSSIRLSTDIFDVERILGGNVLRPFRRFANYKVVKIRYHVSVFSPSTYSINEVRCGVSTVLYSSFDIFDNPDKNFYQTIIGDCNYFDGNFQVYDSCSFRGDVNPNKKYGESNCGYLKKQRFTRSTDNRNNNPFGLCYFYLANKHISGVEPPIAKGYITFGVHFFGDRSPKISDNFRIPSSCFVPLVSDFWVYFVFEYHITTQFKITKYDFLMLCCSYVKPCVLPEEVNNYVELNYVPFRTIRAKVQLCSGHYSNVDVPKSCSGGILETVDVELRPVDHVTISLERKIGSLPDWWDRKSRECGLKK